MKAISNLLLLSIILASLFGSCAKSKAPQEQRGEALIDVLTDFSIELNSGNYQKALNFLDPTEKAMFVNTEGQISEEAIANLSSLNLQKLTTNPKLTLYKGKIRGLASFGTSSQTPNPLRDLVDDLPENSMEAAPIPELESQKKEGEKPILNKTEPGANENENSSGP